MYKEIRLVVSLMQAYEVEFEIFDVVRQDDVVANEIRIRHK